MKNRPLRDRLGFAVAGWQAAWRRERSFRTQACCAVLAIVALLILRPSPIWWTLIVVTSALVLALELINSALEAVIDRFHPKIHPEIKAAKDMLAGAVLAISVAALIVAVALVTTQAPALLGELATWQ
ncbi:diacylglycerol kinase [Sphingomonas alpina]|uniref:Diacylglycerol kinase n=1 Tax=Sphingomonas alpina TaxID=653931 RepID=A0A7H0LP24_9SPHN|nr:diacylglycerol kinase [Sphingomonas alpina]QNQ11427.1 diacylglycerol kinase [Sphingomonas alpina]